MALCSIMCFAWPLAQTLAQERTLEVPLTKDEAEELRRLVAADEYLQDLAKAQQGLAALNKLLTYAPGPVKLVFKWNEGPIAAWAKANERLAEIKKKVTCIRLAELEVMSDQNAAFFADLQRARGC